MYSANTNGYEPFRDDIKVYTEDKLGNPHYSSRLYKILSHIYDPVEWSVYVDADIYLPDGMAERLIADVQASGKKIGVFRHPEGRDCIYQEAEAIIRLGKDTKERVEAHLAFLRTSGYPEHAGLAACGILVRQHCPEIKQLNEQWWAEVCARSRRDQMSFNYVFRDVHYFAPEYGNFYQWKNKYKNLV